MSLNRTEQKSLDENHVMTLKKERDFIHTKIYYLSVFYESVQWFVNVLKVKRIQRGFFL